MMTWLRRSRLSSTFLFLVFLPGSLPLSAWADSTAAAGDTPGRVEAGAAKQAGTVGAPATAGTPQATPPADIATSISEARGLIRNGNYDGAIGILSAVLQSERERIAADREVYLLLIEAHVQQGNYYRFRDQGRVPSELSYQEAQRKIVECLSTKELRHVRPEPASEYAEETIRFFADVRSRLFGSFRVVKLAPGPAVVLLDADTLRALPPENLIGDVDIPVGQHLVVVRAPGHKGVTEEITVSPNSTLERSYGLSRQHGKAWYAALGAGALAVVGGAIALAGGGDTGTTAAAQEPLPGPPPPPAN